MTELEHKPIIIGEVKDRTPHNPRWRPEESWEERFEIAEEYADWISIHTHESWGGSFRLLEKIRDRTTKPILAKGFHQTDELLEKAFNIGADYALRVGNQLPPDEYMDRVLLEPYTILDLKQLTTSGLLWAVWNSRNPGTGVTKVDGFDEARRVRPREPEKLLCQASNIRTWADVHPGANAVLVGTHWPQFAKTIPQAS